MIGVKNLKRRYPPPPRKCTGCRGELFWRWDDRHGLTGEFVCLAYPRCHESATPHRSRP